MVLAELVEALVTRDALTAREWVAEARRSGWRSESAAIPSASDDLRRAIAAAAVEFLCSYSGRQAPSWTRSVHGVATPFAMVAAANALPRLRRLCETEGPEPFRRRNLLAPPGFLTIA